MRATIALATWRRHRARTLLAVAGVAISAALLLDMVMLATGMRESFRELLGVVGFDLRVAPRGTLPFDSEAAIADPELVMGRLRGDQALAAVSPVLGATMHLETATGGRATSFAIGIDPRVQGDYELVRGDEIAGEDDLVVSEELSNAIGAGVGDTVVVAFGYDPTLRTALSERRMRVAAAGRFIYAARQQRILAMPLETLRRLTGQPGGISLVMMRTRPGVDADSVRTRLERELPSVSVISTATAIRQVDDRLSYFRQLAAVLGSISLFVGFLLVTTLVTISVNERLGEIAVLRAIGLSRARIVEQVLIETTSIALAGTALGFILGLGTARWLNGILVEFPGLPAGIDFFLLQPSAAGRALGLLAMAAAGAAVYPAWRAASMPIATTLRREAIA